MSISDADDLGATFPVKLLLSQSSDTVLGDTVTALKNC